MYSQEQVAADREAVIGEQRTDLSARSGEISQLKERLATQEALREEFVEKLKTAKTERNEIRIDLEESKHRDLL